METTMSSRGRVVIPAVLRRTLDIKTGTRLHVEEREGAIVFSPLNRRYFERFAGMLEGSGVLEGLVKSRAEDLEREDKAARRLGRQSRKAR
ncbi:MAG: AbrB/MazE/SpoVT family DNA-binding domain-containing protein [Deltaproteobacteria bacterium]|nr:AbrB/MazE/SpoVT family DNA-binding domain-containing protein [Deltaproteobacteria bacterium]